MKKTFKFKSVGRSDLGLARENNEDSGFIGQKYLLVADGMGGHAAGELASATAVSVISNFDNKENQNVDLIIKEISLSNKGIIYSSSVLPSLTSPSVIKIWVI